MYQIYIGFCVILSFFNEGSALVYKEGEKVKVNCDPEKSGTSTYWFKMNSSGAAYIFTLRGNEAKSIVDLSKYAVNVDGSGKATLTIQNFQKKTDSGLYTCASLNNNQLFFGKPFETQGEPDPTELPEITTTTPKTISETTTKSEIKTSGVIFNCETWILSSLASGCVFLLILLNITILYCNHLRTSHCHHTSIIQPQTTPADHSELLNTSL